MKITLVIPCYNEEANIQKGVLDKFGNYTKENEIFSEVLIVDDGSTDSSKKLIREKYLPKFLKFKLVEIKHEGKAGAVITGIQKAKGDYVMFSDIDLATPIEEAEDLLEQVEKGYKIVIGSRNSRREGAPFLRRIMAVGFIFIRNFVIGLPGIKDTQCGFKIFEKEAADRIITQLQVFHKIKIINGSSVSAGFDTEFLFIGHKLGYKIKEVPVDWRHVETKNVNFLKDTIETLRDILLIKYYDLSKKYNKE